MTAAQLKASILQLAIQGKLVTQDPNDEPAEMLLERIRVSRGECVEHGEDFNAEAQRRRGRGRSPSAPHGRARTPAAPPVTDDEKPFDLPANWTWCRLGDVFDIARGGSPRPIQEYLTNDPSGLNWIKIGDTKKGSKYIRSVREKIKPEGLRKTRQVYRGDLLLTNSMSFGEAYILDVDGCIHDGWLVMHPIVDDISRDYFLYVLGSPLALEQFKAMAAGAVVLNLNSEKVRATIIPLPPLAEQKRIVAKIEELMPLVERYAAAKAESDELEANLPDAFRKSVLQQAVEGKLVPQDPNDEPASALLAKISFAITAKAPVKRSKKCVCCETIDEDDVPLEIPQSWEWCRLGSLTEFLRRGKSPVYVEQGGYPMFAQKCNQWEGVQLDKCKFCSAEKYESFDEESHLHDYDVVINSTGTGTLGRVGLFRLSELEPFGFKSITPDSHVTIVRTPYAILNQYLRYFFSTQYMWNWLNEHADGSTKQKELYTSTLASVLISLPPLAEQKRIVAKIEQLLGIGRDLVEKTI